MVGSCVDFLCVGFPPFCLSFSPSGVMTFRDITFFSFSVCSDEQISNPPPPKKKKTGMLISKHISLVGRCIT